MSVEIHPIILSGPWDLGYALDVHVISSIPMGEDPYGNALFQTERSPIGELLYEYKYRFQMDRLDEIVDTVVDFLLSHSQMLEAETIIPVPPTRDNKRVYQPTCEIAREVATRLQKYYCDNILEKNSEIQLKGRSAEEKGRLGNFIVKNKNATRRHSVLLIDDLFQTGTTLNCCTTRLREDPLIDKIYVLTITKTKNR